MRRFGRNPDQDVEVDYIAFRKKQANPFWTNGIVHKATKIKSGWALVYTRWIEAIIPKQNVILI